MDGTAYRTAPECSFYLELSQQMNMYDPDLIHFWMFVGYIVASNVTLPKSKTIRQTLATKCYYTYTHFLARHLVWKDVLKFIETYATEYPYNGKGKDPNEQLVEGEEDETADPEVIKDQTEYWRQKMLDINFRYHELFEIESNKIQSSEQRKHSLWVQARCDSKIAGEVFDEYFYNGLLDMAPGRMHYTEKDASCPVRNWLYSDTGIFTKEDNILADQTN